MITDELLKDIETKARAATPGPWTRCKYEPWGLITEGTESGPFIVIPELKVDSDFIAAANPQTVLTMVERIRELEAAVDEMVEASATAVRYLKEG